MTQNYSKLNLSEPNISKVAITLKQNPLFNYFSALLIYNDVKNLKLMSSFYLQNFKLNSTGDFADQRRRVLTTLLP
jgi:hypothetical protein